MFFRGLANYVVPWFKVCSTHPLATSNVALTLYEVYFCAVALVVVTLRVPSLFDVTTRVQVAIAILLQDDIVEEISSVNLDPLMTERNIRVDVYLTPNSRPSLTESKVLSQRLTIHDHGIPQHVDVPAPIMSL